MKSKRFKNLLGALLGGFLGIQALGWTSKPWALVIGVLLGAVIGWYHMEIWRLATALPEKLAHLRVKRAQRSQGEKRPLREAVRLSRWVGFLIFVPTMSMLLWQAWLSLVRAYDYVSELHPLDSWPILLIAMMMCFVVCLPFLFFCSFFEAGEGGMAIRGAYRFYGTNKFRFVLMRLAKMLLGQLHTTILVVAVAICLVPLYALLVAVIVSLMLTFSFKLLAHTMVFAVTRRDHLACFVVTLIVTSLMGWMFQDSIHDPRTRWMVALGAGILSGFAMELVRVLKPTRFFKWVQANKEVDPLEANAWFVNILRISATWLRDRTLPLRSVL